MRTTRGRGVTHGRAYCIATCASCIHAISHPDPYLLRSVRATIQTRGWKAEPSPLPSAPTAKTDTTQAKVKDTHHRGGAHARRRKTAHHGDGRQEADTGGAGQPKAGGLRIVMLIASLFACPQTMPFRIPNLLCYRTGKRVENKAQPLPHGPHGQVRHNRGRKNGQHRTGQQEADMAGAGKPKAGGLRIFVLIVSLLACPESMPYPTLIHTCCARCALHNKHECGKQGPAPSPRPQTRPGTKAAPRRGGGTTRGVSPCRAYCNATCVSCTQTMPNPYPYLLCSMHATTQAEESKTQALSHDPQHGHKSGLAERQRQGTARQHRKYPK